MFSSKGFREYLILQGYDKELVNQIKLSKVIALFMRCLRYCIRNGIRLTVRNAGTFTIDYFKVKQQKNDEITSI